MNPSYIGAAETKIVTLSEQSKKLPENILSLRTMSVDDFIENHASGTLRKSKKIGFRWQNLYKEERVAYEFGWCFECVPVTRVCFGDAVTEGDCHSVTEAAWHIERYITKSLYPEDVWQAKYLQIEYADGSKKEGIGLICRQTSAEWIGQNNILFAMVAEFNTTTMEWEDAQNPF